MAIDKKAWLEAIKERHRAKELIDTPSDIELKSRGEKFNVEYLSPKLTILADAAPRKQSKVAICFRKKGDNWIYFCLGTEAQAQLCTEFTHAEVEAAAKTAFDFGIKPTIESKKGQIEKITFKIDLT